MIKKIMSLILTFSVMGTVVYGAEPSKIYNTPFKKLQELSEVHPRIYITDEKIEELKKSFQENENHMYWYDRFIKSTDTKLLIPLTPYVKSVDDEEWMRSIADEVVNFAFAYQLTKDTKYSDFGEKYLLNICSYPSWGMTRPDLAAGHMLFACGLAYDWLYEALSTEARAKVKAVLLERGYWMYEHAIRTDGWFWTQEWLQNHMWIDVTGMAAAALAIYDEDSSVLPWINQAFVMMKRTMEELGDDGFSHEGYGYWDYGVRWMFRFMDISKELLDHDMYTDNEWFENTTDFAVQLLIPRDYWTTASRNLDYADDTKGDWGTPDEAMKKLAKEYKNETAQWLAMEYDRRGLSGTTSWLDIMWFDPLIPEKPMMESELFKHFTDMDVVTARSDWSGNESLLMFKAGPYIGHEAINANNTDPIIDWGGGHVHPDVNHFILYGNGDYLIRDDGYAQKYTSNHNTLLIDGRGQMGEGVMWFNSREPQEVKATPRIKKAVHRENYDYIVGEGHAAYARNTDLRKFKRHMLFLKPDLLIVIDDIELKKPRDLQLRFFPEAESTFQLADDSYFLSGVNSNMRIANLYSDEGQFTSKEVPYVNREGQWTDRLCFVAEKEQADKWVNATAISWSDNNESPAVVSSDKNKNVFTFESNGQRVSININTETVKVTGALRTSDHEIKVKVNNQLLESDTEAVLENGRVMVPFRALAEYLGAEVSYSPDDRKIICNKDGREIELKIDSADAYIDGEKITLDAPALSLEGRTLVPVRFIAEGFGNVVKWNERTKTVFISSVDEGDDEFSNDTSLGFISLRGKKWADFDTEIYEYNLEKTWPTGTPIPISVIPGNMSSIVQMSDPASAEKVVISITSANGKSKGEYVINLVKPRGIGTYEITGITSSINDPVIESLLIDGELGVHFAAEEDGAYIQYDLGEKRLVGGVGIGFHLGNTRRGKFEIQLSDDEESWRQVYSGESSGTTTDIEVIRFAASEARYVRLVGHGNSANTWNSFNEFGIYGTEKVVKSAKIEAEASMVFVNKDLKLTPHVYLEDDSLVKDYSVTYESDNQGIARVSDSGMVTGISEGEVTIKATFKIGNDTRIVKTILNVSVPAVILKVTDDASVLSWQFDANFNSLQQCEIRTAENSGTDREAFLKFDLSEVKESVKRARLYVYGSASVAEPKVFWGVRSSENTKWKESSLTWSIKPKYSKFIEVKHIKNTAEWIEFDVTDYIISQIKKDTMATLAITGENISESFGTIRTKEFQNGDYAAYLKVETE